MILEAVGHDNIHALFSCNGEQWVVTEGCVAWFDEGAGAWRKIRETGYRFYWRATAAYDDDTALYIGSDRGLVSRLDFETGQFEIMCGLTDRAIDRIVKDPAGGIVAVARQSPLGRFPVDLSDNIPMLDCEAAVFDGKAWRPLRAAPPSSDAKKWFVKKMPGTEKKQGKDRSMGNFLFGPAPSGKDEAAPRYYIKDVFWPEFLCASKDGKHLWLATFTGLVRLDV
jgi:hypothetical protein